MTEARLAQQAHDGRRRRWRWRLLIVLILAAGVGGFAALQKFKPQPVVRAPVRQLPLVRVEILQVRQGPLEVSGNGLVRPRNEAVLGAEVSGRVIYVSPALVSGGRVRKGQVLIRLDPEPFRAALAQAEADQRAAQVALVLAEQSVRRTEDLIAQGFLSRQTLDERIANRDQARAGLARVQALARQRRLDVERTSIRAPFDGRVLSARVDIGEAVQPGRELARVFADDALEIVVSLSDRDMALIADPWAAGGANGSQTGPRPSAAAAAPARAVVTVAHGGYRYRWNGTVERVEAAVDSATRTFNVVVRVPRPDDRGAPVGVAPTPGPPLLVGMYASVDIVGRDVGPHALLPGSAVTDDGRVWLVDDRGRLLGQQVRVLSERDDKLVVGVTELPAGARVVVSDLRVATPGMEVRVVDDAATAAGARRAVGAAGQGAGTEPRR